MNVKIEIEYDGTNYHGWQKQKNSISIQEIMENAIKKVLNEEVKLIGAGRTDAGVHAKGQVANFHTNTKIPMEKLPYAINSQLPPDIVVKSATIVPEDFHARYSAKAKVYTYTIYNSKFPSPFYRYYSYFYPFQLDLKSMREAASYIVGEHDFAAFKASNSSVKNTVRTVNSLEVIKLGDIIKIEVEANGFLYNMVRIIAGTLLNVGIRKIKPEEIIEIIESKDRSRAGPTLPASGLCLEKVIYDEA